MKKLFFVICVFASFNLYVETEVDRIIWELGKIKG